MSKNYFDISKKNIIICGGSGQLGVPLIKYLLDKDANIINLDIINAKINNKNYDFYKVDVSKEISVSKTISLLIKKYRKIDILINLFHFKGDQKLKPFCSFFNEFHNYPTAIWKKTIDINLNGLFYVCKHVLKNMLKNKKGVIVNTSSTYGINSPVKYIYGKSGINNPICYTTTKAAIINFTKYIATHYGDSNIRANTLSPGGIKNNNQSKYFVNQYKKRTPMQRMANADEFNESVLYLISDASRYVTGSNLVVDGGWTAW
jgi:NAD(P)-dependent dehydrogenase (short-subunit alcohol dehydrogenase family)